MTEGRAPPEGREKAEEAAAFLLGAPGGANYRPAAHCSGERLGPAMLHTIQPLLGRGMNWGWGRVLGRDTSDVLSSGPIISLWDESKTTILRVTARHSGGMGCGVGAGQEERTEAGARGTHSFTPPAFLPRIFWSLLASWTLPQRGPENLADWKARLCLPREGYPPEVISCFS